MSSVSLKNWSPPIEKHLPTPLICTVLLSSGVAVSSRPEVGAGYGHSRVGQDRGGEFSGPGRHTIHLCKNNTNTHVTEYSGQLFCWE